MNLIDTFIRDRDGRVVLYQHPNLPAIIWIVSSLLSFVLSGTLQQIIMIMAYGSGILWALLELTMGVNYFRRVLGAIVLIALLIGIAMYFG